MTTPATQAAAEEFARKEGMNPEDLTLVQQFKDRAIHFKEALDNLARQSERVKQFPTLQSEYSALMSRGEYIKSAVQAATSAVDSVMNFFGLSGLNGLGFVPLLPIAAISAAMAAITYWITDVYAFSKRLDSMTALQAKGYTAEEASNIVAKAAGGSSWMGTALKLGGAALLLFLILRGKIA